MVAFVLLIVVILIVCVAMLVTSNPFDNGATEPSQHTFPGFVVAIQIRGKEKDAPAELLWPLALCIC